MARIASNRSRSNGSLVKARPLCASACSRFARSSQSGSMAPIEASFSDDAPADALHSPGAMSSDAVEVFRSARRKECEERAFVLLAVGVPGEIVHFPSEPAFVE